MRLSHRDQVFADFFEHVYVPVLQILKETAKEVVEVDELVPHERMQQQTVEVIVSQILKETVEVVELHPHERVQQPTVEMPMPQILKETVEQVRLSSREHVFTKSFQHVDVPAPQISKDHFEMERLSPCEHVFSTDFQHVGVPVVQVLKDNFEVVRFPLVNTFLRGVCNTSMYQSLKILKMSLCVLFRNVGRPGSVTSGHPLLVTSCFWMSGLCRTWCISLGTETARTNFAFLASWRITTYA